METEIDHTKKLALQIKNDIEIASSDERLQILENLYKKWILKPNQQNNLFDYLKLALYNFGIEDLDNLQIGAFERSKKVIVFQLNYLHLFFMKEDHKPDQKEIYEEKFSKLFKAIIDADNAIQSSLHLKSSMTQEEIGKEKKLTKQDLFRFTEIDYDELSSYQSLLMYLYEQLQRKGYRRVIQDNGIGVCFQRIYTKEGYDTHAWKYAMTIEEFVLDVTKKDFNFKMWSNRTGNTGNLNAAVKELSVSLEPEFDDFVSDRHVFSFENGIYITNVWDEEECKWGDQWIPFKGPGSKKIGANIVSCKYFEGLEFVDCSKGTNGTVGYDDWFDIIKNHCPSLRHIMEYQCWPEPVQRWFCILIGRLFYKIKELGEDWQVIPFGLGQAGAGKSTLIDNVIRLLYKEEDVGVLSNNIEKKFGVGAIIGKKIFIAPEIKENLCLEQAEFQSMISGEFMQVNVKNKMASAARFDVPGFGCGNALPSFTDNAGSFSRRMVVFPFNYKVKPGEGNTKLGEGLRKELSFIMQACNKGYLQAINDNGSKGIWDILPNFFKETKEQLAEDSNALLNFLKSEHVELGPQHEVYCREKTFVAAFNDHCREQFLGTNKWCSQYYLGPFSDMGIKVSKNTRKTYPRINGSACTGVFILGVDIKETSKKQVEDTNLFDM